MIQVHEPDTYLIFEYEGSALSDKHAGPSLARVLKATLRGEHNGHDETNLSYWVSFVGRNTSTFCGPHQVIRHIGPPPVCTISTGGGEILLEKHGLSKCLAVLATTSYPLSILGVYYVGTDHELHQLRGDDFYERFKEDN